MAGLEDLPYIKIPLENAPGEFAIVDNDYHGRYLSQFSWRINQHRTPYRSSRLSEALPIKGKPVGLITAIRATFDPPPARELWAWHKNGNKLDFRRENLEFVPISVINTESRKKIDYKNRKQNPASVKNERSRFRGVGRNFNSKSWHVQFRGRTFRPYATEEEAARVYDTMAFLEWGENAILNFPEEYGLEKKAKPQKKRPKKIPYTATKEELERARRNRWKKK